MGSTKLITFRVNEDWAKILDQIVMDEIVKTGNRRQSVANVIRKALMEKYPKLKGQETAPKPKGGQDGLEFNV